MTRKTAKKAGVVLYGCLMISIPAVLYLELHSYILWGMLLVCLMFAMAMGLMWVSEAEEKPDKSDKPRAAVSPTD